MNIGIRIVWSVALVLIATSVAWFIFAPVTTFLDGVGQDTQIGMLFIFICMPSIFFFILSLGQLVKSWFQTARTPQYVWTILTCVYALGLIAALYFRFLA